MLLKLNELYLHKHQERPLIVLRYYELKTTELLRMIYILTLLPRAKCT